VERRKTTVTTRGQEKKYYAKKCGGELRTSGNGNKKVV